LALEAFARAVVHDTALSIWLTQPSAGGFQSIAIRAILNAKRGQYRQKFGTLVMPAAAPKPVIFISYSHKDHKWLEFVQGHLQVAVTNGHFEAWDDRRVEGGADWAEEINAALGKCAAFILLVSRNSLVSKFILKKEVKAALSAHAKRGVKIYLIIVEAVEIDAVPWLKKMNIRPRDAKALELYTPRARREKVMAELAREIRDIVKKNVSPTPSNKTVPSKVPPPSDVPTPPTTSNVPAPLNVPIVSNIPISVPLHFLGRDEALQAIEEALAVREGRVAITTLHGLRGVGKSTLAAAYAEGHRGDYRATWWIRAQDEALMRRSRRARRAARLGRRR
jgi:hypothetical protein